jgi:hypothetical protein
MNKIIKKKFHQGFIWNLWGSITYESAKTLHNILLISFLPVQAYGLIGSMFAVMYLTTKIADFGMSHSIPPFFNLMTSSKQQFKKIFISWFMLPQIPFIIACACAAVYFYHNRFSTAGSGLYSFVIPSIIFLETLRGFLRYFLHMAFKSKVIVACEVASYIVYLLLIWLPYAVLGWPLTLNSIFIPHIIDSAAITVLFFILLYNIYKELPSVEKPEYENNLTRRIIKARFFNYAARITRELFSKHFLTPLFALRFGLAKAGMFFFAGTIATSIQSIIKVVIGYSGYALLANLKHAQHHEKQRAFHLMSKRLVTMIAPIGIFILINHQHILALSRREDLAFVTLSMMLLFLTVILTEFFFILYEQFYIVEEATQKLFFFKLFEVLMFYLLIFSAPILSVTNTLIRIIFIRIVTLAAVSLNAFFIWNIYPHIRTRKRYLLAATVFSVICYLIGKAFI